jgi:hypothetical protein
MNKLIIHAENFTVFKEKQTWEIKKLNFFYGETGTGKSSLIKLIELFSAAEFETRDLTNFDPFGPYANFANILFDMSKPLRVSFEITNALGRIVYSYEIELCKKTNTGLIANFDVIFNDQVIFNFGHGDGRLYTLPMVELYKCVKALRQEESSKSIDEENSAMATVFLSPLIGLAHKSIFIGEAEIEFLQRTPELPMKKSEESNDHGQFFPNMMELFEINDFNSLDEFIESVSFFISNCFHAVGSYVGRNLVNTAYADQRFHGSKFFEPVRSNYHTFPSNDKIDEKKLNVVVKDLHLPTIIKLDVFDSEGAKCGYTYYFEYKGNKRVQFHQLSSMEQKQFAFLNILLEHESYHNKYNFYPDKPLLFINNLEQLASETSGLHFIKTLKKHFPFHSFLFETQNKNFENLAVELQKSKGIKKRDVAIYHFQKNKKNNTSHVSKHGLTRRNEIFPPLYNPNKINENWKKKIPFQLHFN